MKVLELLTGFAEKIKERVNTTSRNKKLALGFLSALVVYKAVKSALRRPKDLTGKVVFITGAANGIGKSLAVQLAREGAKVVIADIDHINGEKLANRLLSENLQAISVHCDVSSVDSIQKAASTVRTHFGTPSILINNAAIITGLNITDNSSISIEKVFKVNIISHYHTIKEFLPDMISANEGHVVEISSVAAHFGLPRFADYCATKSAIFALCESLRNELRVLKSDVKTTCVCPGVVDTALSKGDDRKSMLKPKYVARKIVNAIKYDQEVAYIPRYFTLFLFLKSILPTKTSDKLIALRGRDQPSTRELDSKN